MHSDITWPAAACRLDRDLTRTAGQKFTHTHTHIHTHTHTLHCLLSETGFKFAAYLRFNKVYLSVHAIVVEYVCVCVCVCARRREL